MLFLQFTAHPRQQVLYTAPECKHVNCVWGSGGYAEPLSKGPRAEKKLRAHVDIWSEDKEIQEGRVIVQQLHF